MNMAQHYRLVARTNGVGVDRDVRIMTSALEQSNQRVLFSHYRSINPFARLYSRPNRAETLIFLERITARWLRRAGRFLLIPNQERYPRRDVRLLSKVDRVLCKTAHAAEIFRDLHDDVELLGFTSIDRRLRDIAPDYSQFLHLAGGSALKGTSTLLEVWSRHPEWPVLTLIRHRRDAARMNVPKNVRLIDHYLSDDELQRIQNSCGVHICPSMSEGWGHYIVEAMSCAAVVIATDGPPMNELVRSERGILVPYARSEPRKLGINFYVAADALDRAISETLERSTAEKQALGQAARVWYEHNHAAFLGNVRRLLSTR